MSETKHTPGPWKYKPTSGYDYGSTIYFVPGVCYNIGSEANARLIAAAPELLEALEWLVSIQSIVSIPEAMHKLTYQRAVEQAEAAIAKAKGEQP